jgi:hypothetical protein
MYNIFWYDQNVDGKENTKIIQEFKNRGHEVFTFSSVSEGKQFIDKWLTSSSTRKKVCLDKDTLVICSGSYKNDVISHVLNYNKKVGFIDRFKQLIIFCGNSSFHQGAKDMYPELIHDIVDNPRKLRDAVGDIVWKIEHSILEENMEDFN